MARERDRQHVGLTALLASEAPVGVIFRRFRSKLFQLVMWNRETDQFDPGQWFKGRLYPYCSDISPDGRHLIYFAMGGLKWAIPSTGGTWTAISRLPSLTALGLWGQGDTWAGGGKFTSNESFWLNADGNTFLIRDDSGLRRDLHRPSGWPLERNGWVLHKAGAKRGYRLTGPDGFNLDCKTWEWADWDRERLVWTEQGCLRTAPLDSRGPGPVKTLQDFNSLPK
jgi:hypothetical protein